MAHARKLDFVFRRNGRVHLNRRGRQFSRLLAAEVCASAVAMLDAPCSEVVWRVLDTYSIRRFLLHFLSRASPCAITFQLDSYTFFCPLLFCWLLLTSGKNDKTTLNSVWGLRLVRSLACALHCRTFRSEFIFETLIVTDECSMWET